MKTIFLFDDTTLPGGKNEIGGKGYALAELGRKGFPVPVTACIPCGVYEIFLHSNGLSEKIQLELNRKNLTDSRWEEIWDISLRIRNLMLSEPMPFAIEGEIIDFVDKHFRGTSLAVRSSAPEEDHKDASFAGLHDSYVNIKGGEAVALHVRKVWASLWSDRALLYRQELGLRVERSSMAVLVQELVAGTSSGIIFSQDPAESSNMIIESVHGLNQGLVDGEVEPDRWVVKRGECRIVSHTPALSREKCAAPYNSGVRLVPLDQKRAAVPPVDEQTVHRLCELALRLEKVQQCPQDIEWTYKSQICLLQSRAITALHQGENKDTRSWYLSLTRSYDNLCRLRSDIEEKYLPQMEKEAADLGEKPLDGLSDNELVKAIEHRLALSEKWVKIYWDECIPFAHGVRLFGEVYNDLIKPKDPYEFVTLLSGGSLLSTARNGIMLRLASWLRANPETKSRLLQSTLEDIEDTEFQSLYREFIDKFGNPFDLYNLAGETEADAESNLKSILLQYCELGDDATTTADNGRAARERTFLRSMGTHYPFSGTEILELGRASYRLRDDDNIVLGKIDQQVEGALKEARKRLTFRGAAPAAGLGANKIMAALRGNVGDRVSPQRQKKTFSASESKIRARQLVGQPASPGIAKARARLFDSSMRFETFQRGEILVVEAIDPNMTFLAPLAAAIVERRGGMLIHGAIIAREYGIPCVTGIPQATDMIVTGDMLTVDGYLGIVTIQRHKEM